MATWNTLIVLKQEGSAIGPMEVDTIELNTDYRLCIVPYIKKTEYSRRLIP